MSLKKTSLLVPLLIAGMILTYVGYRFIYQPHDTVEQMDNLYKGDVDNFLEMVQNDKVMGAGAVQLSGQVTSVDSNDFMIDGKIFCQIDSNIAIDGMQVGVDVSVLGRYVGYDELLEEVKLDFVKIVD